MVDGGLPAASLKSMANDIAARRPVAISFDPVTGAMLDTGDSGSQSRSPRNRDMSGRQSGLSDDGSCFEFIELPPRRMIVVGGVHITQFLAPMAQAAGYDVIVIDPREVFVTDARFPGIACFGGWPDEVMPDLGLDERTAIVTLTHDPKIDDPGLQSALKSPVFYIGCLGSRRTHAARCDRLQEAGFNEADLQRLHGPAGLDIGAKTPAEIAVSILAEMITVERRGGA